MERGINNYYFIIRGDINSLISNAVDTIINLVEKSNVIGLHTIEARQYPEVALYEIVTNAVIHRDYGIATDIQIHIYTNRIEVESPGRLPGHITVDNILTEQFSRNQQVVRLLSKFPHPPNKDVGEGLNSAFTAMLKMQLKKPIILEKENSVLVVIKHERLADHEESVIKYIEKYGSITNAQGRELTGITDTNRMKDVFKRLRKQGKIIFRKPKNCRGHWEFVETGENRKTEKDNSEQLVFSVVLALIFTKTNPPGCVGL